MNLSLFVSIAVILTAILLTMKFQAYRKAEDEKQLRQRQRDEENGGIRP